MPFYEEMKAGPAGGTPLNVARLNEPFHLSEVTYDAANDRLVFTFGRGRAWFASTLYDQAAPFTVYQNTPAIDTTYYAYLTSAGVVISTTSTPTGGQIPLGAVAVGATKNTLTRSDRRSMVDAAGAQALAGGPFTNLLIALEGIMSQVSSKTVRLGAGVGNVGATEAAIYSPDGPLLLGATTPDNSASDRAFLRLVNLGANGAVIQAFKSVSGGNPVAAALALGAGATPGHVIVNADGTVTFTSATTVTNALAATGASARITVNGDGNSADRVNTGLVRLLTTQPLAANVGASISFGGVYTAGGGQADWAQIRGNKDNATDGNYAGHLILLTRPNGGSMTERMRIGSDGVVTIQQTLTVESGKRVATDQRSIIHAIIF